VTARHQIILRDENLRQRVIELIGALNLDKLWQITIEPYRKKRSLSQNALMWVWLEEVVKHVHETTGQDKDDIHEFFKAKFLPARQVEMAGDTIEYRTTTKLTTAEMSAYMNAIEAWATSELGLLLPLPVELGR
jgi:hypothetical protein